MSFRAITHLETLSVLQGLNQKREPLYRDDGEGQQAIALRTPGKDGACADHAVLKEWPAMQRLLGAMRKALAKDEAALRVLDPRGVLGCAWVTRLGAGQVTPWDKDVATYEYAAQHKRFHLGLVTNPQAWLYSSGATVHVPAGALVWIDTSVWHCAANFGPAPRIHLVADFKVRGDE